MKKEKKEVNLRQSLQNAIFSVSELFRFNKRFVIANFIIVIGLHLMYAFESTYYVKWLIEELRVSYFAQQLGVRISVSDKRIENEFKRILEEFPEHS